MNIWVDADACPAVIKDILFRAAERTETMLTLVANQPVRVPKSAFIRSVQVGKGFDVADNEIIRRLEPNDLVITADIPLAAEVIDKGGHALNPRGELYSQDTIKARL
ncbi:MAG: YaiI/YqxD family protein, partial [Gammaproteobacteria bacterium]|nr:YaiI/YqxD family protein [Gammaproteobacteria bacterium]